MSILKKTKMILARCGLGSEQFVQTAGKSIPRYVVRLSIILLMTGIIITEGILCIIDYANGFAAILYSFSILLTYLSATLIYGSLIVKSNKIIDLFNYLEKVTNSSNVQFSSNFPEYSKFLTIYVNDKLHEKACTKYMYKLKFYFLIGTQLSADLFTVYQSLNVSINKMIEIGLSFASISAVIVHLIPTLCPLLYVIIRYPTPDLWFTPYNTQNVLAHSFIILR